MASKSDNVNFDEFEQAARAIFEVVDELGDKGFNPACVSACLIMHATQLSFATCDNPTLIFKNLLFTLLESIPEPKQDFDTELKKQITHKNPRRISN